MRGHGVVVAGASLPQVVLRSVYTEVNARLQAQAMALGGGVAYLSPGATWGWRPSRSDSRGSS